MSIRVSPVIPGRAYAVSCNGKRQVVLAPHGADAIVRFLESVGGLEP